MWSNVKRIIQNGRRFVLTTHLNPDGDGIGSAAALMELLLRLGKQALFVCDRPIADRYHFLDFHGHFRHFTSKEDFLPFDVLVVLDTYNKERIGRVAELMDQPGVTTLWIDHHPSSAPPDSHAWIDPKACSVGAMIYTLFKESGYALNLFAALGIYTSIITDTGRFSYASTSREAHMLADECLKLGVDPSQMYARLFQQVPMCQIEIFKRALKRMEFYHNNRIILQQIRYSDYAHLCDPEDLSLIQDFDYIHQFNKSIKGIYCAAILWELPDNSVRVSLRSNSGYDIVGPMKKIGGGGHPNAAGALLSIPFEEAKKRVLNLLKSCLLSYDSNNKG